jgi:hypothetical protein
MVTQIELVTAPGKYYIDLAFEKINRELSTRPWIYVESKVSYKKPSSENSKGNHLENRTKII